MSLNPNDIYNIDCLKGFSQLKDGSVDLVLTDPPFGVRKKEEWDNKDYFKQNLKTWLSESYRVSKNGVIWFCATSMLPTILSESEALGMELNRILIWNKPPGSQYAGASHNNIWYSFEPILIFKKSDDLLKKGKSEKFNYSVMDYRTIPKKKFNHPTTKPLELMETLIKYYSDINETILDPFSGSGTTLVASKRLNRNYIGFELDKDHVKTAKGRILNGV